MTKRHIDSKIIQIKWINQSRDIGSTSNTYITTSYHSFTFRVMVRCILKKEGAFNVSFASDQQGLVGWVIINCNWLTDWCFQQELTGLRASAVQRIMDRLSYVYKKQSRSRTRTAYKTMGEKEGGGAEKTKPLPVAHSTSTSDEETAAAPSQFLPWFSAHCLRQRQSDFWCCGAAVIVLGMAALVLAFPILQLKGPKLAVNFLIGTGRPIEATSLLARSSPTSPSRTLISRAGVACAPAVEVGADRWPWLWFVKIFSVIVLYLH